MSTQMESRPLLTIIGSVFPIVAGAFSIMTGILPLIGWLSAIFGAIAGAYGIMAKREQYRLARLQRIKMEREVPYEQTC